MFNVLVQIKHFLQLSSFFYRDSQTKRKKTNRELNVDRQFFKDVIYFFNATMCNLIVGGTAPILRKNCHPFHPFPIYYTTPSKMKIFIHSTYPFLLEVPSSLINHIFSCKSNTGLDIASFLSRCKIFNKTWSVYWKRFMEPIKHLSWSFLQKKCWRLIAENNFWHKVPPWKFERILNFINFYFGESYTYQLLASVSSKSIDLMQNTRPLLTTSPTYN